MKRTFNIIIGLVAVIFAAASCQKEEQPLVTHDPALVGEWHLDEIKAEDQDITADVDVYLCINAEGYFELYQKSGTQSTRFDLYTGKCKTENGIVTGTYSNGKPWGSKYYYSKTNEGILLKTVNHIEEQKYSNCQIPISVKENANLINTKAAGAAGSPIL